MTAFTSAEFGTRLTKTVDQQLTAMRGELTAEEYRWKMIFRKLGRCAGAGLECRA